MNASVRRLLSDYGLLDQPAGWELSGRVRPDLVVCDECDALYKRRALAPREIARCPRCRIALWSHYGGSGPAVSFVRVGTLDEPDRLPPDAHIFTASKQPWVLLPPGTPAFAEYYERETLWPAESLARRERLLPQIAAWQAARQKKDA